MRWLVGLLIIANFFFFFLDQPPGATAVPGIRRIVPSTKAFFSVTECFEGLLFQPGWIRHVYFLTLLKPTCCFFFYRSVCLQVQ